MCNVCTYFCFYVVCEKYRKTWNMYNYKFNRNNHCFLPRFMIMSLCQELWAIIDNSCNFWKFYSLLYNIICGNFILSFITFGNFNILVPETDGRQDSIIVASVLDTGCCIGYPPIQPLENRKKPNRTIQTDSAFLAFHRSGKTHYFWPICVINLFF